MSPEEFLSALQDITQKAETKEGYLEYLIEIVNFLREVSR